MDRIEFGADGIRYIAGKPPLTQKGCLRLGAALARFALTLCDHPFVVIGRDTRPSGEWIVKHILTSMLRFGIDGIDLGVITTPGVAYLTRRLECTLGLAVSASHNPLAYNGVKVVGSKGLRLQREEEIQIESWCNAAEQLERAHPNLSGQLTDGKNLVETYIQAHVERCPIKSLEGFCLVLDCANGAASQIAPEAFRRLGARVKVLHTKQEGRQINHRAGSEHVRFQPHELVQKIRQTGAEYGFAFDGDGDRLVVVNPNGVVFDGDDLLYALAVYFDSLSMLRGKTIVTTELANQGLDDALARHNIKVVRTGKGDKALEGEMWNGDYMLGGEPSGNILINDGYHTAADAIYTAIVLAGTLKAIGHDLTDLVTSFHKRPQVLASVRLSEPLPHEILIALREQTRESIALLGENCRIKTWMSSTEPGLFKVMVEGHYSHKLNQVTTVARGHCEIACRGNKETMANIAVQHSSERKRI